MKTIEIQHSQLESYFNLPKHVIALGFFDGLHKGHQKVILKAKEEANKKNLPLSVMSFFPHPKSVLSNGKTKVNYLMPLEEKQRRLKELGVDYFFIVEFTLDFAALSPEQFVQDYLIGLGAVHIVCGYDYTYGKYGAGNITTLYEHGKGKLDVSVVPKVDLYGEKISSTRIRELLQKGEIELITKLLGKPYEVEWSQSDGLSPYYTLPTPGYYEVTIRSNGSSQEGIVEVIDNQTIYFDIPINEVCTILWHRKINQEKYQVS